MGEHSIPISLPLDSDGFLRRECPECERQFKWFPSQPGEQDAEHEEEPEIEAYYCPYCQQPAAPNAWWTKEQLEYAQQVAAAEIVAPRLREFKEDVEGIGTGGLVNFEVTLSPMARPEPLSEPDDMVRVEFPCHLEEPVKVEEDWEGEVACLVCGIVYPFELVRVLPEDTKE